MFDIQEFIDGKIGLKFESEEVYDAFMQQVEKGYPEVAWRSGDKPTEPHKYKYIDILWCNYFGNEPNTLSRNGNKKDRREITVTKEDFMNTLTIDMLKTGDILVMEDDYTYKYGMLLKDTDIGVVIRWDPDKWSGVCYSKESVTDALEKVKRVERPVEVYLFCTFEPDMRNKIIWERKTIKELTVAQIEELLGYKVKVVADEKG